jgi:hypothetical protein
MAVQLKWRCNMAKRKRRAVAQKKAAAKRGKARARVKSTRRKVAKRAGRKTKAKKQTIRPRAKRTAPKKTGPRPTEPPRQPAGATEEAVIVDIIEEPAPGVVVVTEFASVQTTTPLPKGSKGFGLDGAEEDGGD